MFDAVFNLTALNGANGFRVPGSNERDKVGCSVSSAGDINGDGKNDLIIGAEGVNSGQGAAYIIFGKKNFTAQFNVSTLTGANGFMVPGYIGDYLGNSVSSAGDINGDGIDDLVIGAAPLGNRLQGAAYVIFGQKNFTAQFNLSTLNGANGFMVLPEFSKGNFLGHSVSTAGDINGDGIDDLVIGAPYANRFQGAVYVIFGQKNFTAQFNLSTLNGANGFSISGLNNFVVPSITIGLSVSTARDINNDGIDDVVIGAPAVNKLQGAAYVIFGQKNFPAQFNLSTLNGANGFSISGLNTKDALGKSVSAAGDINGDTIDDLVLGAVRADNTTGAAYMIFGQKNFPAQFNLSTLNGANGFSIPGLNAGDSLGYSVSTAGDINGDGIDDVAIGADGVNSGQGAAYVIFGEKNFTAQFDLSKLNGANGFSIPGLTRGYLGFSVSTARDINGDGIDDLVIGAPSENNVRGAAYVIFGNNNTLSPELYNNYLLALQGKAVPLNLTNINASDFRATNSELLIITSNVQHGQFEYVNQPNVAITNFTQYNVSTSSVQFRTDNSYMAPSYDISVKNTKNITTGPNPATIIFHDAPRLTHNQLTLKDGETVVLSSNDLQATENYTPEGSLIFTVSDIQQGKFQINASTQSVIDVTTFAQQNVTDGKIRFVHDGSNVAPNYAISVSDGELSSGAPTNAKIDFKVVPPTDNTLKIVLGTLGGVAGIAAIAALGFFANKRNKSADETNTMQNEPSKTPSEAKAGKQIPLEEMSGDETDVVPIPLDSSDAEAGEQIPQEEMENQPSSLGCQLF